MFRAVLSLVLALTLLAPHRLCLCAHAATTPTESTTPVDECPCRLVGAQHADPTDVAEPWQPPCPGHEPCCGAHQPNADRSAGTADRIVVDTPSAGSLPQPPLTPSTVAVAGPPVDPPRDPDRPLYLSHCTLLI
jgi:hypothetical protein